MPFAWPPTALDDLHRLYVREKRSASQTARAMGAGLTRNAVLGKVQRMGWTRAEGPKAGRPAAPDKPGLVRPPPTRIRAGGPFSKVLPLPTLREITVISTPKLWTERAFGECAFPVGEPVEPGRQYACCAKVSGRSAYPFQTQQMLDSAVGLIPHTGTTTNHGSELDFNEGASLNNPMDLFGLKII